MYFLRSFLGFFFLGAFHPHSCIRLFVIGIFSLHRHRFVSCYTTSPLSFFLFCRSSLILFFSGVQTKVQTSIASSTSFVVIILVPSTCLFCYRFVTITCFATITYCFSLHTIVSHSIMTHYYTVELSMDICRVSGKSICTSSLNFFIVNPFRDFGDESFPTKCRATWPADHRS